MTIEAVITKHLTENAGVAALIAGRVYPKQLPQGPTYPAIVYHRISGPRVHSHDGASGLAYPRFQFDCFAKTHVQAKALCDAVRLAIDGFKGLMGGAGGVDVQAVFCEDDTDDYDDELKVHVQQLDAVFWHAE